MRSFNAGFLTALLLVSLAALLLTPAACADELPLREALLSLGDILPCNENPCAYLVYVHEDMMSGAEAFGNISAITGSQFVELIQTNTYSGESHTHKQANLS